MDTSGCRVIRSGETYTGRQGFAYRIGLTGASAGSKAICMTALTLPPGARANTHLHRGIETAVYVIEGEVEMLHGPRLGERLVAHADEYVYVPADVAHRVMNRSGAPCRAIVAHTAADDQEGIVPLPELDALTP
ncbi:MAG: cupin domain-containing protein [Candidatus Eisenbacteria bacterium]